MLSKCFPVCACVLLVSASVYAGEAAEEPVPPAREIAGEAFNRSVRAAVVKAVDYIRTQAAKDEEGWVAPPIRQRKVVDYKEVTVRYAKKTFHEPVYEYETYETYERAMGDTSLSSKKLRKVKRRRIKRQIGTRAVVRLVHHPKGPITRTVKQAIWGKGGPDFWAVGRFGHNALALLALRKAGVGADEDVVSRLAENLANFVEDYGSPDTTWDLACMTAAFATMPDGRYHGLAKAMAGKLLDGQITNGPAKGLWGPVSISTKALAAALKYEQILSKMLEREKARLDKRKTPSVQKRFDKIEATLLKLQHDIVRHIAITSSALEKIDYRVYLMPEDRNHVTMIGLPHYVFTQTTADVESTALALWALRIAAEKGLLPKRTSRPMVSGRPILPPQYSATVLSRAARALVAAQLADGGWNEMNKHQAVRDFDGIIGLPGVPLRRSRFPVLVSKTTGISTWQGYTGLLSAGHALGLDRLLARLRSNATRGSDRARALAEKFLDGKLEAKTIGLRVPPFDCYLFLTGVNREFQGPVEDRRDLWLRLSCKLVDSQNANGSWGSVYPLAYFLPTSLRARIDSKDRKMRMTPASPPRSRPHVMFTRNEKGEPAWRYHSWGRRAPLMKSKRPHRAGHYLFDKVLHATACAILFLADGVRAPVAGECAWSDKAGLSGLLAEGVSLIRKRRNVSLSYAPVKPELPPEDIVALPVLLIRGAGAFELTPGARKSLRGYLERDGLVLVAAKTDKAGSQFLKEARAALEGLVKGGVAKDIGESEDLLGEMAKKITLNAVTRPKGSPAVVFLPVSRSSRPPKPDLTASQAAAVVSELLLRRVPADVMKEAYPTTLDGPGEAEIDEELKLDDK